MVRGIVGDGIMINFWMIVFGKIGHEIILHEKIRLDVPYMVHDQMTRRHIPSIGADGHGEMQLMDVM